jgi:hypothetical protein
VSGQSSVSGWKGGLAPTLDKHNGSPLVSNSLHKPGAALRERVGRNTAACPRVRPCYCAGCAGEKSSRRARHLLGRRARKPRAQSLFHLRTLLRSHYGARAQSKSKPVARKSCAGMPKACRFSPWPGSGGGTGLWCANPFVSLCSPGSLLLADDLHWIARPAISPNAGQKDATRRPHCGGNCASGDWMAVPPEAGARG